MAVTYAEAKKILSRYAGLGGTCESGDNLDLFCKQVFQYLLFSGQYGNLRKFCFKSQKGCVTLPYELETPLKVKIDGHVGTSWSKWFEFYNIGELEGCVPVANAMYEEPNTFPTVYDPPNPYCRIGALATADESSEASIIISGKDASGREIITNHQGEQITGEKISIVKGSIHYTNIPFAQITAVNKDKTNGYVQLFWIRPELSLKGFLADYSPFETTPQYRRFKITTPNCGPEVKVSILGRIRLKDHYADSDVIPFDNLYALQIAGQAQNSQFNNDVQMADAKDKTMQEIITRENEYKRVMPGAPLDIYFPLSGGSIKNIVG